MYYFRLTRGSSSSSSLHSVSSDDMSSSKAVSVDKETKTGVRVSVPSSAVIQVSCFHAIDNIVLGISWTNLLIVEIHSNKLVYQYKYTYMGICWS